MKAARNRFTWADGAICMAATVFTALVCICLGSVNIPLADTLRALVGKPVEGVAQSVVLPIRLPRVLCVALTGGALSLCGGAMQGLLGNPLADGSTLGVSSGAALGAVLAIAFGISIPAIPMAGTLVLAIGFAFLTLVGILALTYRLDASFSTQTMILLGVIFSMFASALMSLVITFAGERVKQITFWTMGSLANSTYVDLLILAVTLLVFGFLILRRGQELNAIAMGEDSALHVGVAVKRVKLEMLIAVAALTGVCVAVGGTIGFVGLVIPHMVRLVVGPNHKRLLPYCVFAGAVFLMLADLATRTLLSPKELPIGVVTSMIGAVVFVLLFVRNRRRA